MLAHNMKLLRSTSTNNRKEETLENKQRQIDTDQMFCRD